MQTACFGELYHGDDVRAGATRPSGAAAHRTDRTRQASTADLRFTLRVALVAALVELGLLAYALLGGGTTAGIG